MLLTVWKDLAASNLGDNHVIERLDPALTSRPGRSDRVIHVMPPDADVRRELSDERFIDTAQRVRSILTERWPKPSP